MALKIDFNCFSHAGQRKPVFYFLSNPFLKFPWNGRNRKKKKKINKENYLKSKCKTFKMLLSKECILFQLIKYNNNNNNGNGTVYEK